MAQPNAQTLYFFMLTGDFTVVIPGVLRAGPAGIAEALDWPFENCQAASKELASNGLIEADPASRLIFIPRALADNPPANPNVVKLWRRTFEELPDCPLKVRIASAIRSFLKAFSKGFLRAFDQGLPEAFKKNLCEGSQEDLPKTVSVTAAESVTAAKEKKGSPASRAPSAGALFTEPDQSQKPRSQKLRKKPETTWPYGDDPPTDQFIAECRANDVDPEAEWKRWRGEMKGHGKTYRDWGAVMPNRVATAVEQGRTISAKANGNSNGRNHSLLTTTTETVAKKSAEEAQGLERARFLQLGESK